MKFGKAACDVSETERQFLRIYGIINCAEGMLSQNHDRLKRP
jgi:hypothetical protein